MRYVPYAYFLRIPLLFAVVLALLPVVGLWTGGGPNPVVGGFFDLANGTEVFEVCFAALLYGAAVSVITALVLVYGNARFFAAPLQAGDLETRKVGTLRIPRIAVGFIVFYGLCAATMIAGVIYGAEHATWKTRILPAGIAIAIFVLVMFAVGAVWSHVGSGATRIFARGLTWTPFGLLKRRAGQVRYGEWPFQEPPELLPGHGFALLMMAVFAFFYGLFAFGRYHYLRQIEDGAAASLRLALPTLGSVIVALTLVCWILGVLAFLLDRYRIPVLLPIAALLVLTAQFAESDHYFEVRDLQDAVPLSPSDALRTPDGLPEGTAIVVAAAGGGIQASAWTARVLTGLVEQTKGDFGDRFSKSIRAISSVSGGSAATMFFVYAYEDGRLDPARTETVFEAASASSLDDVAWGLVYPDWIRSVAPLLLPPRIDRGWAVERAWLKYLGASFAKSESLSQWRRDAREHRRPAVIFNTTLVETGERFLIPTVDLSTARGRRSFHDIPGHEALDLAAVTAARLSATFPYVTPVSRAACCPPLSSRYHVADGGYYDNYGLASISELLDQATVSQAEHPVKKVLLVQILLSEPGSPAAAGSRGWFFQVFAPLATVLHSRDAAQLSRNETEFRLLQEALRARHVELARARFVYRRDAGSEKEPPPPLSWHLTKDQVKRIRDRWQSYIDNKEDIAQVTKFLREAR